MINAFLKETFHNIRCGSHSGIKPCCIIWCKTIWKLLNFHRRKKYMNFASQQNNKIHPGYIPCLLCSFRKDFIKVKKCSCGQQLYEKYQKSGWHKVSWKFLFKMSMPV